ncbi:MAG: hypothetical protein HC820_08560 [Hydrococcus sp. RM1_1_31]|nr:hypothetical protein [Hydrococcus sp. RM1_1_31]
MQNALQIFHLKLYQIVSRESDTISDFFWLVADEIVEFFENNFQKIENYFEEIVPPSKDSRRPLTVLAIHHKNK